MKWLRVWLGGLPETYAGGNQLVDYGGDFASFWVVGRYRSLLSLEKGTL